MILGKNTAKIRFDKNDPGKVTFYLPVRIPADGRVTASLKTLRKFDGIADVECQLNSFELCVVLSRQFDIEDTMTAIISTLIALMDLGTVQELTLRAKVNKISMAAERFLVDALRQLAEREWENNHSVKLKEARENGDAAQTTLSELEELTCPDFKVDVAIHGEVAWFRLSEDPDDEEADSVEDQSVDQAEPQDAEPEDDEDKEPEEESGDNS